jgi:hypothetical protein
MQYLLLRRCEQSFFYDEQVRIKRWRLFDDEEPLGGEPA